MVLLIIDLRQDKFICKVSLSVVVYFSVNWTDFSSAFLRRELREAPYLYKRQISPKVEYFFFYIWAGAAQSPLSVVDIIPKYFRVLLGDKLFSTLQHLSHRQDVASLPLLSIAMVSFQMNYTT